MSRIPIAGAPRSIFEIEFLAGTRACEGCGDDRPLAWKTGGGGSQWVVHARCPRCQEERAYLFESALDLAEVEPPELELGGPEPSQVMDAYELMRELYRLPPAIALDAHHLSGGAWDANFELAERMLIALNELEKFIPAGEEQVPPSAFRSEKGSADGREREDQYTRSWIAQARARWTAAVGALAEDAPRAMQR